VISTQRNTKDGIHDGQWKDLAWGVGGVGLAYFPWAWKEIWLHSVELT